MAEKGEKPGKYSAEDLTKMLSVRSAETEQRPKSAN
jgi:hypothetical protein